MPSKANTPILRSDYSYDLPESLIAKSPANPRDHSRMMVLNKKEQFIRNQRFFDLPDLLQPDSVLVVNDSRVIPARLPGKRVSGGFFELLLVQPEGGNHWRCKVKNSGRLKIGESLSLCEGKLHANLLEKQEDGDCIIQFCNTTDLLLDLEKFGYAPIPPYIHKARQNQGDRKKDLKAYQTVYADEYGSIAAPTAGLHFTDETLEKIKKKNIEILTVTLHVGIGTFEPIRVDDVTHHKMHEETFHISNEVAKTIEDAKKTGRIVTAVGTTTVRTLEAAWHKDGFQTGWQKTSLFIYPPYQYSIPDQILTNFHLPQSTLLMLICAFGGKDFILDAYRKAVEEQFRFFSFGDCMFIT